MVVHSESDVVWLVFQLLFSIFSSATLIVLVPVSLKFLLEIKFHNHFQDHLYRIPNLDLKNHHFPGQKNDIHHHYHFASFVFFLFSLFSRKVPKETTILKKII